MTITTGRCLCGEVQYEFRGAPGRTFLCHCESCRRHTSSPVAAFIVVSRDAFRLVRGVPAAYASSPGVRRSFCARCGSPIAYQAERVPDEVHLYHGTLSDPALHGPRAHVFAAEQLPWFEVLDRLPRYRHGSRGAEPVRFGPRQATP